MFILYRYVLRGVLLAFLMAMGILLFGLTGANLVKVLDLVSQGVSLVTFGKFILYIMPPMLTFAIPWAMLIAVMLVFGRMSADSEITAMRACGISILQIISPITFMTLILTALCLYLQVEIGPPMLFKSRALMSNAMLDQPLAIFEPGKPIFWGETLIYIDAKEGENGIRGVQLYTLDKNKKQEDKSVSAVSGVVTADKEKQLLTIELEDCIVSDRADNRDETVDRFFTKHMEFSFNYGRQANAERVNLKEKYMRLQDLMGRIRMCKGKGMDTTELEVELNQRIAFALAPIAFMLIGIPLAIRTSRRETSVGIFISMLLAGVYFLSIIMCESLDSHPSI
ncbi:MAG: LptF/LptG family permease, partial [Victivallaceae bacterium]|nr:LptF/LptG family permease [Victivallaceae bacterium]